MSEDNHFRYCMTCQGSRSIIDLYTRLSIKEKEFAREKINKIIKIRNSNAPTKIDKYRQIKILQRKVDWYMSIANTYKKDAELEERKMNYCYERWRRIFGDQ